MSHFKVRIAFKMTIKQSNILINILIIYENLSIFTLNKAHGRNIFGTLQTYIKNKDFNIQK